MRIKLGNESGRQFEGPFPESEDAMDSQSEDQLRQGLPLFKRLLVALACCGFLFYGWAAFADQGKMLKPYDVEKKAYDACVEGQKLIDQHSYTQAKDVLNRAAASDPTSYSGNVHLALATCCYQMQDYPAAVTEGELAVKFSPTDVHALYNLAIACERMKKYDRAMRLLNQAAKVTTDSGTAAEMKKTLKEIAVYKYMDDASKLIKDGRNAEAQQLLENAASMDPSKFSASVHDNLTFVCERTGHPDRAIAEGKKAIQFGSTSPETYYTIAIAYQDMGKFDDAISWLKKYIAAETDDADRSKANDFMQELTDDREKLHPELNARPDYLDQLKSNDDVNMWPQGRMPLKVFIDPAKDVSGYRPVFRPFVIRSLNEWCAQSGAKLSYQLVNEKKGADMIVKWTRDPLTMEESGRVRQKAGLTTVTQNADNKIKKAVVRIRTVNGFSADRSITDGEAAEVTMHEIGHAMGLGHSTCCSDIMYFGSSSMQSGFPTKRDKATIARLYKSYPVIAFNAPTAVIPEGTHIEYLPPPQFLPPAPVSTEKLAPPMFVPPPIAAQAKKLQPPMFMPPPIAPQKNSNPNKNNGNSKTPPPFFAPPPK